jgi:hypothetical protein
VVGRDIGHYAAGRVQIVEWLAAVPARVSAGVGSEKMTSTKERRFSAFDRVSRHPQRRFLMLFPNNWKHKNRKKHWIFCGVAGFEQD